MSVLTVADICTYPVETVEYDTSVREALRQMGKRRISALVVVRDGKPIGIYTERNAVLVAHSRKLPDDLTVAEVMGQPLLSVPPEMDYCVAYQLSQDERVRHLVVIDSQGDVRGIVTEANFLNHLGYEYLVNFKEVGAVMTRNVVSLPGDAAAGDAVDLMAVRKFSCIVVVGGQRPVGILSERDLVRLIGHGLALEETPLREIMSTPVRTVTLSHDLIKTVQVMEKKSIRRLVVVDEHGQVAGLVTRHDLVKMLYNRHVEHLQEVIDRLREELSGEPDRLYHHLLEHSVDLIAVAHVRTGRLIEVNARVTEVLNCPKEKVLDLRLQDLVEGMSQQEWETRAADCMAGSDSLFAAGFGFGGENLLPVEISLSRVQSVPDDYLVAVIRDISARLAKEQALSRSQERLRLSAVVFENTTEGVIITDEQARIIDVNNAFSNITGYSREEVLGRNPAMLKSGRHDELFYL